MPSSLLLTSSPTPFLFPPASASSLVSCFSFPVSGLIFFILFFLQARPNGDSMFGGDKQTHAASESSLGKYGCLGFGPPLPQGVQTKAQLWLAEIVFTSAAFGDIGHACTMQVVKNLQWVWTPHALESRDHGVNLQTLA